MKRSTIATVITAAVLALTACNPGESELSFEDAQQRAEQVVEAAKDATATAAATTAKAGTASATLAKLPVKGRAPKTGYTRTSFGQAWLDADRNGCDTRNDILNRDLTAKKVTNCKVMSGTLTKDPYTGTTIKFVRGGAYANALDIDHVVALSAAWQTGAQYKDKRARAALANDPLNLLAVNPSQNRQKGDSDAASWLPKNKGYRCKYVARQIAVKAKYGLWVTAPEKTAMQNVLKTCPSEPLPKSSAPAIVPFAVK